MKFLSKVFVMCLLLCISPIQVYGIQRYTDGETSRDPTHDKSQNTDEDSNSGTYNVESSAPVYLRIYGEGAPPKEPNNDEQQNPTEKPSDIESILKDVNTGLRENIDWLFGGFCSLCLLLLLFSYNRKKLND